MKTPELARTLDVLGDEQRLRLWRLVSEQELSVGELTEIVQLPQSTVSRHLKSLREAGLVADRRVGTAVFYQHAAAEPSSLEAHLAEWVCRQALATSDAKRLRDVVAARGNGQRTHAFFDHFADQWDALRRQYFGDHFAYESMLSLLPRDWVAGDIGCGTGYLLPALARQFAQVVAVDPAESMLSRARQRVAQAGLDNVEFRPGWLDRLPIDTGSLDLALASLVLHHVSDPGVAVRELTRVVKPGGRVLVIELDQHDDQEFVAEMGDTWPGFSELQMAGWMKQAGLREVRTIALARPGSGTQPPTRTRAPGLHASVGTRPGTSR